MVEMLSLGTSFTDKRNILKAIGCSWRV